MERTRVSEPQSSIHHVVFSDKCLSESEVSRQYVEMLRLFSVEVKGDSSGIPRNSDK